MSRFSWLVASLVVLGIGTLIAINVWQQNRARQPIGRFQPDDVGAKSLPDGPSAADKDPAKALADGLGISEQDLVDIGGVKRPKTDVVDSQARDPKMAETLILPDPGQIKGVSFEANDNTRSVAEALNNKELSHRLTSILPAPPFDPEEYRKDPDEYLRKVEPGRIWQSRKRGAGVIPIARAGSPYRQILQGEKAVLETKAEPGMPVTFYSPRLGQFDNQLSTITVKADESGVARTSFLASSGTRGEIDILATSPVHSGQARFVINVVLPNAPRNQPAEPAK